MPEENKEIINEQISNESIESPEETVKKDFDYRRAREERIIRSTEKRILKELGENSLEDVKMHLQDRINISKELNEQKDNGLKLSVYKNGFDDQFVDFVVHDLKTNFKVDTPEDLKKTLEKYKSSHPQFLKNKVVFNTSKNFENQPKLSNSHERMNAFFRGQSRSI